MRARFVAVIGGILLIYAAINWYIGWHLAVFLSAVFSFKPAGLYWSCFWLIAFSYLIARLGSRLPAGPLFRALKLIGSYWMAVMLYSIILLPAADIAAWLLHMAAVSPSVYVPIIGYTVLALLLIILVYGSRNAWSPIVRRYEVTVAKKAGERQQLRIAMASDIHLGTIVGNRHLNRLVERINAIEPDIILLPGDVIDDDIEPFIRRRMGTVMQRLHAALGVYAVLGNHEYIGGHIEEFVKEMNSASIEVLMDRNVKIDDSFYLIGRKDYAVARFGSGGRLSLEELLAGVDRSYPLIMMDHQPHHLDQAAHAGIDISLSGHTHRGQMAPSHWITRRLFELDWGFLRKGNLHAIVSSGYGSWGPPIRIGSRSEIIEVTVNFDGAESQK
jgi:predicted MPP superfamily phosphohydrolase